MDTLQSKKRSSSIGPKLTMKQVEENPLLLPLPPPDLSRELQKEWTKAHIAMHNLDLAKGNHDLGTQLQSRLPQLPMQQARPVQEPKAKGKAKASASASWALPSFRLWKPANWMMRGAGSFLSVLLVAALLSGASGPVGQVARMLGSAAMFSEAAADNAVAVLNATGRMAASVSELAVSALGNSMALGETAWHGVDIYSVAAKKCVVHLTADSEIVLIEWLKSNEASILVPCISNDVVSAVQAAANAVTHGLPEAETTTENLLMLGNYSEVHLQAVLNDVGQVQVRFTIVGVNFRILWSNPIWETFEFAKDALCNPGFVFQWHLA